MFFSIPITRHLRGGGGGDLVVHFVVYPKKYLFIFLKQYLFHQIHVASKIDFAKVQNVYQRWINEYIHIWVKYGIKFTFVI